MNSTYSELVGEFRDDADKIEEDIPTDYAKGRAAGLRAAARRLEQEGRF